MSLIKTMLMQWLINNCFAVIYAFFLHDILGVMFVRVAIVVVIHIRLISTPLPYPITMIEQA